MDVVVDIFDIVIAVFLIGFAVFAIGALLVPMLHEADNYESLYQDVSCFTQELPLQETSMRGANLVSVNPRPTSVGYGDVLAGLKTRYYSYEELMLLISVQDSTAISVDKLDMHNVINPDLLKKVYQKEGNVNEVPSSMSGALGTDSFMSAIRYYGDAPTDKVTGNFGSEKNTAVLAINNELGAKAEDFIIEATYYDTEDIYSYGLNLQGESGPASTLAECAKIYSVDYRFPILGYEGKQFKVSTPGESTIQDSVNFEHLYCGEARYVVNVKGYMNNVLGGASYNLDTKQDFRNLIESIPTK